MELKLSDNIRSFRKQRKLTQEQLADVLNVTAGAVYKWESGLSVPDLSLIVEMADFFDTSVDVLLGYKMKDNRIESTVKRLKEYRRVGNPEALTEAAKALKKYPNSFEVVHECAQVYSFFGIGQPDKKNLYRALELLEQARLMTGQNANPEISEMTVLGEMAQIYLLAGETEKGIELLKKYNANSIFSDYIGFTLAYETDRCEEAETFLSDSLLVNTVRLVNTVMGYAVVFCKRKDYISAQNVLTLGLEFLRGVKKENIPAFTDKIDAMLLTLLAFTRIRTREKEKAAVCLRKARQLVSRFDSAPDYAMTAFRFVENPESASASDSLGITALESIENLITMLNDPDLSAMWKGTEKHG